MHFPNFTWDAATGATLADYNDMRGEAHVRANVYEQLPSLTDPIPAADEFVTGLGHKPNNPSATGELWPLLRAMRSRKMYFFTKLQRVLETREVKLAQAYPDLRPDSGGMQFRSPNICRPWWKHLPTTPGRQMLGALSICRSGHRDPNICRPPMVGKCLGPQRPWWSANLWDPKHLPTMVVGKCLGPCGLIGKC